MAIPINELQVLDTLQAADRVLLDNAAAGTGLATLDKLRKFILGQTAVPSRTVEVDASELPGYIEALPRLLTEHLTVKASGALTEMLCLKNFYGSGTIMLEGSGDGLTLNQMRINSCRARVQVGNVKFQVSSPAAVDGTRRPAVYVTYTPNVLMQSCEITGDGTCMGLYSNGSSIYFGECGVENCDYAVYSAVSRVSVKNDSGSASKWAGNRVGGCVYCGGIILLAGHTPSLLGGSVNSKQGGIIAKADGTLL